MVVVVVEGSLQYIFINHMEMIMKDSIYHCCQTGNSNLRMICLLNMPFKEFLKK
jgi:hypothetical protein